MPHSTDDTAVYSARLARVQAALHAKGFDFLFVGPSADLLYLTGLNRHPTERLLLLVVHQEGPAHLIAPAFEVTGLGPLPERVHVDAWSEQDDPVALTAHRMSVPDGGAACTIAVNDALLAGFLLRLQAALPRAAFTVAQKVLPPLRVIKDAAEIAVLREAGARADAAFAEFRQLRFSGQTERAMADEITATLRRHGISNEWGPVVGSGPNGALPHHDAGERVIEAGDLVVLDFGGRYQGYQADMTRTVAVGHMPEGEMRAVYEQVRAAQEAAVQAARPGMVAEELDGVARTALHAGGYSQFFTHRLGHGIGLDTHESPYIVSGNRQVLAAGMAFSIEPGLYLPERFGVRIEDIVVLGPDGAERLNNSPHELLVVE